jgi:hypothetical protein
VATDLIFLVRLFHVTKRTSVGTEFKVMREVLRHSTIRSTMDVYTQAITPAKQNALAVMAWSSLPNELGGFMNTSGRRVL